jgi:hypothetical protein
VGKKLLAPALKFYHSKEAYLDSSVWFEFLDQSGRGVCEVDHLLLLPDSVVVVECKLTQTPRGPQQLSGKYLPILRHIFPGVPVRGVMVCKILYEKPEYLVTKLSQVLDLDVNIIPTWHWLG